MSLFRVCSWWSTQCSDVATNYTVENILLCRFGFHENEKDYIVVASHVGYLNIFRPASECNEEGNLTGYTPADLLLECKLNSTIVGIVAGKFGSSSKRNDNYTHIAVLHPLSICVYSVTYVPGMTDCGTQSTLHLVMEHRLEKCSFSICKGQFGGVKGRDFICVTHLDGSLTFFEQDGISYSRNLAGNLLIPCPLVYDPKSDAFIRVSSSWDLESFSYQNLSGSDSVVDATWSVCIGELPIQMMEVRVTKTDIMILGERNLISISDEGKMLFVKKLDYVPICFHSFMLEPNSRLITAVVSNEARLFLYESTSLIWAAQLEILPVAILRANLSGLPGGLVVLSSDGLLQVGFLGSEPYVFQIPQLNSEQINFEKASEELAALEREIKRNIDVADIGVVNTLAENDVEVDIKISNELQKSPFEIPGGLEDFEARMCTFTVNFRANISLDQLQLTFNTDEAISCTNRVVTYTNVACGDVGQFEVSFYVSEKVNICSTKLEVIVSFINKHNIPRIITKSYYMPPQLFYSALPTKSLFGDTVAVDLSLAESLPAPKLSRIFYENDKIDDCNETDSQSITVCDILTENTIEITEVEYNFRIQSNTPEAITPVLELLINHFGNLKTTDSRKDIHKAVVCRPIFPIEEIKRRVLYHHEIQQDIKERTTYMDALWNQFKLFQRCLQSKNEADPTDGLVMLIDTTYDELISAGDLLIQLRQERRRATSNVNCIIGLVNHILRHTSIDGKILEKILPAFSYPVEDWTKNNWEELASPAFNRLVHQRLFDKKKMVLSENPIDCKNSAFQFDRFVEQLTLLLEETNRFYFTHKHNKLKRRSLSRNECAKESDEKISVFNSDLGGSLTPITTEDHAVIN